MESHDHGNNNMEDSPHFSESESDKKQLSLDISIKDEINIEPEKRATERGVMMFTEWFVRLPGFPLHRRSLGSSDSPHYWYRCHSPHSPKADSVTTWNTMEGNSPEYVVSVNSEERDLHQQELVCDLPFIKEELEFCPKENQTKPQSIQPMSGLHCYVMYQGKQGITINTEHSGQDLDSNGIVPTIKTSL
uniref:Uncharacterized protein n=1 Tax=Timema douglasi TaxID=61478 RepID=A0A7R8VN08_TIMDO|nr:unnamed protein product [Timema douglasi]